MNEVEAYSSADGHRVGAVTVPGAMGLSISPDGSEMAVGTDTPHVYLVNPATLHVTDKITIPASVLNPARQLEPAWPFLMATGPMLIDATEGGYGTLISYDPSSGAFAQMNPTGSSGIDLAARSLDGNYLAAADGQQMFLYSAATQTYIGSTPAQASISTVVANPDGSQFVTLGNPASSGGGPYITFWNRSLQQEAQYTTTDTNVVYSRDGKYLYVRNPYNVLALDTQTGQPAGYQGLSIASRIQTTTLYDTDGNNRVYGLSDLGAFVASVGQLQASAPVTLQVGGGAGEGPLSGGTEVQIAPVSAGAGSADGMSSTTEAYFGSVPATKDSVAPCTSCSYGGNVLTATAPATSTGGPVTVLLTDANNNSAFLPGGYSYGPHLLSYSPSAVSPTGGTVSSLYANGIEPQASYVNVSQLTINGADALVKLNSTIGGPLQVTAPAGTPGWGDLKMTLSDGTTETTKNLVQYLSQDVKLPSAAYSAAVYDPSRNRFYLTGADNTVGVFDPGTQTMLQPMTSQAVSSGAVLGSLALTPDDSKLLVSDPTDHSVVVFDLTSGTSSAVSLTLPSNITTLSAPMPIAALSGNRALVIVISPAALDEVQEIDLTNMTAQVRTDVPGESIYGFGQPSSIEASADGNVALLSAGGLGNSEAAVWKYDTASDTFSSPMIVPSTVGDTVAVNADGTVLAIGPFTLDQNLLPLVPFPAGPTRILTGSGALAYDDGGEISDTHNGRLLLTLDTSGTASGYTNDAFAIDPSGQKILICDGTSIHYYKLAVVPLAVATVSPAAAPPGASVTVRGDGFVAGTTATIGGQSASCTTVDSQTLQCTVPNVNTGLEPMTLTNPDGQTYSLEAAVNVQ
jgi:WD40 repeat protein